MMTAGLSPCSRASWVRCITRSARVPASCSISRCFIILPATERGSVPTKVTDLGHL